MRLVSIIGDSISAYEGFLPSGYVPYYTEPTCQQNGLRSVYDMWWAIVNLHLHAYICVCNAYSGSRVSGCQFPAMASQERLQTLHTPEYLPDLILIYGGFNDFGSLTPIEGTGNFRDSYELMLQRIRGNYPRARVICGTLVKSRLKTDLHWDFPYSIGGAPFEEYNAAIRQAAFSAGCEVADLASIGLRYETLDGTHPTALGHQQLAQCWCTALDRIL